MMFAKVLHLKDQEMPTDELWLKWINLIIIQFATRTYEERGGQAAAY